MEFSAVFELYRYSAATIHLVLAPGWELGPAAVTEMVSGTSVITLGCLYCQGYHRIVYGTLRTYCSSPI